MDERLRQLLVAVVFSVPLFYVAMGPMLGWPEVPGLDGMANMMAAALTQLLLCVPILVVNRHYFVTGFKTLAHGAPNMDSLISLGSTAWHGPRARATWRPCTPPPTTSTSTRRA